MTLSFMADSLKFWRIMALRVCDALSSSDDWSSAGLWVSAALCGCDEVESEGFGVGVGFGARVWTPVGSLDGVACAPAGVDGGSDRGDGRCVVFGGAKTLDLGLDGVA